MQSSILWLSAILFFSPCYDVTMDPATQFKALEQFRPAITAASETYGISPALIAAKIMTESSGNPDAVSQAGAKGLMQMQPGTAADVLRRHPEIDYPIDGLYNPDFNTMIGTAYLSDLLEQFKDNKDSAIAAYNAGPRKVRKYKGVPPYKETQDHVSRVKEREAQLEALQW